MKRFFIAIATMLALAAVEMKAQSFEGIWNGAIDVNGSKLVLVNWIKTLTL